LKFRTAGVTHVLFFDPWVFAMTLFMQNAANQHWAPAYGLDSNTVPVTALASGLAPPSQYANSRLVSWDPFGDVPNPPPDPLRDQCFSILKDAGFSYHDNNSQTVQLDYCDSFFVLRQAATAASTPLTQAAFLAGAESLGDRLQTALVGPGRFAPGRHFGPAVYRAAAFDTGCTCYHYTGNPVTIPAA
jgi:hypothetical protein